MLFPISIKSHVNWDKNLLTGVLSLDKQVDFSFWRVQLMVYHVVGNYKKLLSADEMTEENLLEKEIIHFEMKLKPLDYPIKDKGYLPINTLNMQDFITSEAGYYVLDCVVETSKGEFFKEFELKTG